LVSISWGVGARDIGPNLIIFKLQNDIIIKKPFQGFNKYDWHDTKRKMKMPI